MSVLPFGLIASYPFALKLGVAGRNPGANHPYLVFEKQDYGIAFAVTEKAEEMIFGDVENLTPILMDQNFVNLAE
jgi:hypothetical protein